MKHYHPPNTNTEKKHIGQFLKQMSFSYHLSKHKTPQKVKKHDSLHHSVKDFVHKCHINVNFQQFHLFIHSPYSFIF